VRCGAGHSRPHVEGSAELYNVSASDCKTFHSSAKFSLDNIVAAASFRNVDDMARNRLHDLSVLVAISMPIVYVADAALTVICDSMHGVSAEAEPGYL
jgi:hypothetical protein